MITQTHWYTETEDGRILCQLCPRACRMKEGDRGFCFVRKNVAGQMVLDTYGKSTGFCIDPIEKKPLNHFLPGTPVLSFGTAGCNLGCKFCQNWDISKSREVARLSDRAMPNEIALAAQRSGCRSVAYTYNDPVIWAEYAIDTALACREIGIKSVAVTAGYITPQARGEFFGAMDAANIDLKAFSEDFYYKVTSSHLQPVLDTIEFVCNETDCWVELTNLIIPDANDSADEIRRMCTWVMEHVGPNVPIHFTAFHPDFKMTDRNGTDLSTLVMAYDIAKRCGLNYVYVGNVHDIARQSTYCHGCGALLIERDWHQLGRYTLSGNRCSKCDATIPGVFEDVPGDWGGRRQRVRIEPIEQPMQAVGSQQRLVQIEDAGSRLDKTKRQPAVEDKAMATTQWNDLTKLTDDQKSTILKAASAMVQAAVGGLDQSVAIQSLGELAELPIDGVFVTVKRGETLRGCCGRQGGLMKLGEAMADSAARTARDPRMAPLSMSELPYLDLSVSLLGPLRPIGVQGEQREQAVQVGTHGLRIQFGHNSGLLLPQVAIEQGWNARQFLDAVCRKAGLPAGVWLRDDAQVMLFDGVHFGCRFETDPSLLRHEKQLLTRHELSLCRDWVRSNLIALQIGATPMYYAMGVSDLEVLGLILSIRHPSHGSHQWLQLSIKDTRPMQTSLYQMTEQASLWLDERVFSANECDVELAVLSDCVHHGPLEDADMRGTDGGTRAMVLTDGRRWAIQYGQDQQPQALIEAARAMERFRGGEQLYSMHCDCSCDAISVSLGPRADADFTVRRPAVAGAFYPAEDSAREAEVDRLLDGLPDCKKHKAFAVMVPHAGLRFSGRVAAEIWRRIDVPDRVLIIGPKHTADGVDWAVAPHHHWQLSDTVQIAGDEELARELAEQIPGMELDSRAHAREHGIEVQLPLINRLCPDARLAAIAMHGGDLQALDSAASALAEWIKEQDEPPLLVISSDMNHFADDEENRRRDRLALDALATGDGAELLRVCGEESISMCGQIPAALVLMVMRKLGKTAKAEEIAYATSADYGGGQERVVGYAGVIWEDV
ncbi:AmmeMemoRadiSam system radical SAM enzyme [Stieleria sp. ICT_E10.1]|uniref:AmmeMemoRadiSam system radical SAM enzyme n=1 Tax=Stieleria sedimenti TaxID=2976331 RepID=UPI00217F2F46|nr:AmmeMemoRadiSam system radical SAM enzyme [Stieleria sedimenti]MCS7471116.1 AmmeMemoRadiSam system radical SAM enzyme [Stieleria sedimenti]